MSTSPVNRISVRVGHPVLRHRFARTDGPPAPLREAQCLDGTNLEFGDMRPEARARLGHGDCQCVFAGHSNGEAATDSSLNDTSLTLPPLGSDFSVERRLQNVGETGGDIEARHVGLVIVECVESACAPCGAIQGAAR